MNINFTLFMQAIAFFAFILFTAKFVWPPLMRAIDTRQKQIADGIAAGEEGRHSLASAEKRIADMVAEAKDRSSEIIAQGEKLKSETVDAAKAEAKAEADRILVAAKAEIAQETRPREGIAARCGGGSRRRGCCKDPEARSRRESPRGPAGVDPARAVGRNAMAELTTIARPYAEAAFELARTSNALPVWSSMLRYASAVVADPAMAQALDNPKLTAGDKESLILSVCGDKLDAMGRRFVRVLVEADRVAVLPQIAALFDDFKNDTEGVATARIDSAFPLTDAQFAELVEALEKRFGKKIEATVNVDPGLVGGARITVGDTVIDASVQAQLQAMASQLRA